MAKIATGSWEMRRRLAAREPFETYGALHAVAGAMDGAWGPGRLPEPWRTQYVNGWRDNAITYTVISYQTPIAWVLDTGEVVIPDAKYSITTTRHQGLLYALGQPADGPLADAAERERQTARERRAQARERDRDMVAQGYRRVGTGVYERPAATPQGVRYGPGYELRTNHPEPDILTKIDAALAPVPDGAIYSDAYLTRKYGPRKSA